MSKRIDQFADPSTTPVGIKLGGEQNGNDIGVTIGAPNGIPPLGADRKIPADYLPASSGGTAGAVVYMGTWDASTGGAPLGSPQKGQYWIVSVAGTTSVNGISDWGVGDWIVHDGSNWEKVDNTDAESAITYTGTALTLTNGHDRNVISCTNAAAVTVTIPTGLKPDFRVDIEQKGAGQVTIAPQYLAPPVLNAPTTATTGGTLAAGTYYYKATSMNAAGETIASAEVSKATTGTTSTVSLSWPAVAGATKTYIYRGTAAGAENVRFDAGAGTAFTDTGAAGTAATPPASNTAAMVTVNASASKFKTAQLYSVIGVKRRSDGSFVCYGERA